jgi:hypothetical protein
MDKVAFVHRRKKRYMAQILSDFDENVLKHLPRDVADNFKGIVRQKMNAMAIDISEIISLAPGEQVNEDAIALRDRVFPHGKRSAHR